MKTTIQARATFECRSPDHQDDDEDVEILVLTHPEEELGGRKGRVLLMHPRVSLELDVSELERALRSKATFQAIGAIVTALGMLAENQQRAEAGQAPAFSADAFARLADELVAKGA